MKDINCICKDIVEKDIKSFTELLWVDDSYIKGDSFLRAQTLKKEIGNSIVMLEKEEKKSLKNLKKSFVNEKIYKKYYQKLSENYDIQLSKITEIYINTNFNNLSFLDCYNIYMNCLVIKTTVFPNYIEKFLFSIESCFILGNNTMIRKYSENLDEHQKNEIIKMMKNEIEKDDLNALRLLQYKLLYDRLEIIAELDENIPDFVTDSTKEIDLDSKQNIKVLKI